MFKQAFGNIDDIPRTEASLLDGFSRTRDQLRRKDFPHLKPQPELVAELLEDKTSYGEIIEPVRTCWHQPWKAATRRRTTAAMPRGAKS